MLGRKEKKVIFQSLTYFPNISNFSRFRLRVKGIGERLKEAQFVVDKKKVSLFKITSLRSNSICRRSSDLLSIFIFFSLENFSQYDLCERSAHRSISKKLFSLSLGKILILKFWRENESEKFLARKCWRLKFSRLNSIAHFALPQICIFWNNTKHL